MKISQLMGSAHKLWLKRWLVDTCSGGGKKLKVDFSFSGFTLVICPLISLMEDQLMVLKQLEISATMLNASSSKVWSVLFVYCVLTLHWSKGLIYNWVAYKIKTDYYLYQEL